MVDGFFQKEKELYTGSNNDEIDQDIDREVSPATKDSYGDPANDYSDISPASDAPYGDPADEYSNLTSADQDPYGDPADEYGR